MARHFSAPPDQVDRMELWQVVAALTPDPRTEPEAFGGAAPAAPVGPRGLRSIDVIKARYAAHRAGGPEPLHIFGDRDVPDFGGG
jgi:hypothetical protein